MTARDGERRVGGGRSRRQGRYVHRLIHTLYSRNNIIKQLPSS